MDWSSIAGLILGIASIIVGQSMEGGSLSSLYQPAAMIIVLFGTLGAVLLQSRTAHFKHGMQLLPSIFITPIDTRLSLKRQLLSWSELSRRYGNRYLEQFLINGQDPYLAKALQLLVDGVNPVLLQAVCESSISQFEQSQKNAIKIWDSAAGYAPTLGILGAVVGLIHVMENLSDPTLLGTGIAVAFVATIYGVGLANLVFIPISNKLKTRLQLEVSRREMILESMIAISEHEHTLILEERLANYLTDSE